MMGDFVDRLRRFLKGVGSGRHPGLRRQFTGIAKGRLRYEDMQRYRPHQMAGILALKAEVRTTSCRLAQTTGARYPYFC